MSRNTWPANCNGPASDQERIERGLQLVRMYTDQLEPQRKLVDLIPWSAPNGNADGILWGWMMDAQALLHKLQALVEDVMAEKKMPEIAVLEARIAIRHTVNNLRPRAGCIPNFPCNQLGPRSELGQAYAACLCLVQALAALLEGPECSGNSFNIRIIR